MKIEITPRCMELIHSRANSPLRGNSKPLPNGNREITIEDDTFEEIVQIQFPGESISDVIERICLITGRPLS
jgi:hypothetical protein